MSPVKGMPVLSDSCRSLWSISLGSRKLVGVILLITLITELHQLSAKYKLRGIMWQQSAKSLQVEFAQKWTGKNWRL